MENQATIYEWATYTFGLADLSSTIERAREEFDELERATDGRAEAFEVLMEIADIVIILLRAAELLRRDPANAVPTPTLQEAIDLKMAVNRKRAWVRDGKGHGRHAP